MCPRAEEVQAAKLDENFFVLMVWVGFASSASETVLKAG